MYLTTLPSVYNRAQLEILMINRMLSKFFVFSNMFSQYDDKNALHCLFFCDLLKNFRCYEERSVNAKIKRRGHDYFFT